MTAARPYTSVLREDQARQTRERILDALAAIMSRGVAELSIPAVALRAGVSVPTVYRHFGSKRGLLAALPEHLLARTPLLPDPALRNLDDLPRIARDVFRGYHELDETIRAAMASELGKLARREHMPVRLATVRTAIEGSAPGLDRATIDRLARLFVLLMSSASIRAFEDYFDMTGDDAADDVTWGLQTLVLGAQASQAKG